MVAKISRIRDGAAGTDGGMNQLFRERVDALGQTKVEFGQTTLAVGRENQAHLVEADIDVGMMFFIFRDFGHAVHEIDRFGKLIELEGPFDVFLLEFPLGDFFETIFEVVRFDQLGHNGNMSNTPFSFCKRGFEMVFRARFLPFKAREFCADFSRNRKPPRRSRGLRAKVGASR